MAVIRFYHLRAPYGWLSNFSRHPVFLHGLSWPTVEHCFQAAKSSDPHVRELIRKAKRPAEAKRIAWSNPVRPDWDSVRDQVMLEALQEKFTQHPDLAMRLVATGNAQLIEHTHKDAYWGDGGDGSGQNRLGELLMRVRAGLTV